MLLESGEVEAWECFKLFVICFMVMMFIMCDVSCSNYRISDQFFHIFLQSAKDERSLFVGAVALCLHAWHNQVVEKAKQENNLISVTRANHNEVVLEKNNPLERTFTTWTVKTADKN